MLIQAGQRRIHYDLIGNEGAPLVCFAHSLSSDGGMWAEQMRPLLTEGWRVLRVDMRGHGGSDPVEGDYTMAALADDVVLTLDALGFDKAHFIGLSIGGMIGQALSIGHGHRFLSSMLCDTAPGTPPGGKEAWGPRMETVRKAGSLKPLADGTMERWFTDAFKPRNPRRYAEIHSTIAATTATGYLGCAAAILDFDFIPKLPSVTVPTLVVCGDDDQGTPPAGNKKIAELVPGGRYVEIAKARHFPNVEHPDVFNRIMMEWLASKR